jgi:serine/threonine protein phosphatase PrpC
MAWSSVKRVHEASEMNPFHRSTMEDEHRVIDGFLASDTRSGFFAVYDGHGGRGVVDYLKRNLERNVKTELECERENRGVEECLISAYLISDIETSRENLLLSGSTAATCLVLNENSQRVLYAANVGDTRAVLSRGGIATRLTFDHKASEQAEIKRIETAGGFVRSKRVLGVLTVTRSFGDHTMKNLVLARPYTSRVKLMPEDDILLIACDGVWDVFSDQEAIDFVRRAVGQGVDNVADALVKQCLERGTTDNVTVLVVEL